MDTSEPFISVEMKQMLDSAMKAHPESFKDFDRTKNVQDQLQEMVKDTCLDAMFYHVVLLGKVYRMVTNMELPPTDSMEQLWLAFVMHELHQKKWIEGGWVYG